MGGSTTLTLELTILLSSPRAGRHLEHGDHSHRAGGYEPTLPRDVSNEGPAKDHTIRPTQTRITSQVVRVDPLHTCTYMYIVHAIHMHTHWVTYVYIHCTSRLVLHIWLFAAKGVEVH